MSESTILELRQKNSSDVERNGIYKTTLDSAIQIEEGDQVNVKAIYLDTSESSAGLIHLEDDVDITMEMAMYIQNYKLDQRFTSHEQAQSLELRQYVNMGNNVRTPFELGDNNIWWLAQHSENTATTNWKVQKVKITIGDLSKGVDNYGGLTLHFNYVSTAPGAANLVYPLKIKSTRKQKLPPNGEYAVNILSRGDGDGPFITLQETLPTAGITSLTWEPYQQQIAAGETIFTLQRFPLNFTIGAGDYTPGELADIITENIANVEVEGKVNDLYDQNAANTPITKTNWPAMSPFLTTVLKNDAELQRKAITEGETIGQSFVNATDYVVANGNNLGGTFYMEYNLTGMKAEFVAPNAANPANYNPPIDKYVGANEVALIFDENTNKLQFNLHFPIYVNESNAGSNDASPGVVYNGIDNDQPNLFNVPSGMPLRYSGVAFTRLEPTSFWENQLGFGDITITEEMNANLNYPDSTSTPPTHNNSFTIKAKNGEEITGAFPSLDVAVIKSETSFSTPPFSNISLVDVPLIEISNPAIWGINSTKTYNNSIADEGYFIVDVSPNFNQNLIGEIGSSQSSKSTQSIVNRYYTQNSFTSDQGAGSISYTHSGAPQMLSEFQVRVLNPDRSIVKPSILQDKNTVFIEVIKPIKANTTQNSK